MLPRTLSTFAAIVVLGGCSESGTEPDSGDAPIPVVRPSDTEAIETGKRREEGEPSLTPEVVDIEGVKFTIPAGWRRVDPSAVQAGIIAARYEIPVDGEKLLLTFTSARGGIEANFDRWKGQFQLQPGVEPIRQAITLAEGEAHWLDLRGTFTATTGGLSSEDIQEGIRMIGVGIPLDDGEMYLKLLGPVEQVGAVTDEMRELVKSADLP